MKSLLLAFCLALPLLAAAQWKEIPGTIPATFENTCVALDGKVYFAGGPSSASVTVTNYPTQVSILDLATESISIAPNGGLTIGRLGIMTAAYDGKVYFGGGFSWKNQSTTYTFTPFNTIDIYDVNEKKWYTRTLSQKRGYGAAAVVNGKIVFAGGYTMVNGAAVASDVVDIYDPVADVFSVQHLSLARGDFQAATIGSKVWFCGGSPNWVTVSTTTRVDIFDIDAPAGQQWTTAELSIPRAGGAVLAVDQYLICAGGLENPGGYSKQVDIFDTDSLKWKTAKLSAPRWGIAAATLGHKGYFTGGGHVNIAASFYDQSSNRVDVFDAEKNLWSVGGTLKKNRMKHSCAAWGNKIAVGGGWRAEQNMTTGSVEILTDGISSAKNPTSESTTFTLSPNPATDVLTIVFSENDGVSKPSEMQVSDLSGRVLLRQKLTPGETAHPVSLPIERLPAGSYFLSVVGEGQLAGTRRFVVLR